MKGLGSCVSRDSGARGEDVEGMIHTERKETVKKMVFIALERMPRSFDLPEAGGGEGTLPSSRRGGGGGHARWG